MAIAKKNEGEVIAFDRNSVLEEFAGEGLEEVTAEDLAIPFLRVLAQLSPQVNKRDGAYVDGAEAGMIYNTVAKATVVRMCFPMETYSPTQLSFS